MNSVELENGRFEAVRQGLQYAIAIDGIPEWAECIDLEEPLSLDPENPTRNEDGAPLAEDDLPIDPIDVQVFRLVVTTPANLTDEDYTALGYSGGRGSSLLLSFLKDMRRQYPGVESRSTISLVYFVRKP